MTDGIGYDKWGFEKLRFCGGRAKIVDLHYFWVDTCSNIQNHHRRQYPTKGVAYAIENDESFHLALNTLVEGAGSGTIKPKTKSCRLQNDYRTLGAFCREISLFPLLAENFNHHISANFYRIKVKTYCNRLIIEVVIIWLQF